jgi:hypothetical protein
MQLGNGVWCCPTTDAGAVAAADDGGVGGDVYSGSPVIDSGYSPTTPEVTIAPYYFADDAGKLVTCKGGGPVLVDGSLYFPTDLACAPVRDPSIDGNCANLSGTVTHGNGWSTDPNMAQGCGPCDSLNGPGSGGIAQCVPLHNGDSPTYLWCC